LRLATNLDELLQFSQRQPAGYSWDEDGTEAVADMSQENPVDKALVGKPLFDQDGTALINQKLPLSVMKQAVLSDALPKHLHRDLAQATWIRAAAMLDDSKTATELIPTVQLLIPGLQPYLESYQAAAPDEKRFNAIYAWLKFPGLEPVVDSGVGSTVPLAEQDSYRDNWWCRAPVTTEPDATEPETEKGILAAAFAIDRNPASPPFLTPAQRQAADREYARLTAAGAGP